MAAPIANDVPTRFKPIDANCVPIKESRESMPKIAIPAAECGITTGISISASIIPLPGNLFRASMYARGIEGIANISVVIAEMHKVNIIEDLTSGSFSVSKRNGAFTDKNMPTTGAIRKRSTSDPRRVKIR